MKYVIRLIIYIGVVFKFNLILVWGGGGGGGDIL